MRIQIHVIYHIKCNTDDGFIFSVNFSSCEYINHFLSVHLSSTEVGVMVTKPRHEEEAIL